MMISFNFDGTQQVDIKSHLTVFGFLRQSQTELSKYIIMPTSMWIISLMYYYIPDLFGIHSQY